ncbi:hypothetical protein N0V93_009387 [Gnomoniopsis smithogilvyi]|uniref:Beta-lactamase-related domain-containing protein n=1 Tax=Gnomoniopsis smithogilvyi TaxID=1191159 RepID=A0A9W8YJJ9_9PEZI|nr:hypothetical protein N0V93_009387 [Gnomoniopsis smithogilvyi]
MGSVEKMMQIDSQSFLEARKIAEKIRSLCRVPAISIGVLHRGKLAFTDSVGVRDVGTDQKPDGDTIYTLCSISKTFVAAALGILVDQGKMDWADPVGKYLPGFRTEGDPTVAEKATFNDFLRHTSGLADPVVTLLGPNGTVLVSKSGLLDVVNETPTKDSEGKPYFNTTWKYSNVAYGMLTLVVEKLSGVSYADFVQDNILTPLRMDHTAVSNEQVESSNNVAKSYAKLSDDSLHELKYEWTSKENSPILGMIGIRSSVNDMLKYCAAVMEASEGDTKKPMDILSTVTENPLKQMNWILRDGYWWTRPHDDQFNNTSRFHAAWMEVEMPSCMTSWGSWNKTLGDLAETEEDKSVRNANILGQNSGKRLLHKSVGCGICGVASVNIFPETQSAVVALSSGINCGDAADFAASVYIQELFNLEPKIDILALAEREVAKRLEDWDTIMRDLDEHRDTSQPEHDPSEYVGEYHGFGITVSIERDIATGKMMVCLNKVEATRQELEYYNVDWYSFWPKTRDEWLKGGWLDWDYYLVGIFKFVRKEGVVTGFTWVWEEGAEPYPFTRKA